jgi:hypothetical protein
MAAQPTSSLAGPPDVDATAVSLRFFGDDLDPDEVSRLLGSDSTHGRKKGAPLPGGATAETGSWLLSSQRLSKNALEDQLHALFDRLTPDLAVWASLAERFRGDVFCGLWAADWNRGVALSARALGRIAERRLAIGFDINFLDDARRS